MFNILLAGVGGQGTVLASKLIAQCALDKNKFVRTAETIGMAQRGGSVVSHVRTGEVYSPLIPKGCADVIIGFEPSEALRVLPYLKKDGIAVINDVVIKPVTATLTHFEYDREKIIGCIKDKASKVVVIDGDRLTKECGTAKVLNVALLGVCAKEGLIECSKEDLINAIKAFVPQKYQELNMKALDAGVSCSKILY